MYELLKKDTITERDYIIVDEEKIYLWFDIYEDGYKDGNIIQNFIMSYIEFEYNDLDLDFKEKEVKAYKEIKNGNLWETQFLGTFIVTDVNQDDTKQTVKVKGFDYALKFTDNYSSELDYASGTITLQDVSNEITDKLGLVNAILDVNGTFIVTDDQFTNTQIQNGTVISLIAGASGNRARIYQDNLVYQFANETTKVLNKYDYTDLEDKRDTLPFTIVILGQADIQGQEAIRIDEELVEQYGENKLVINDNLFAYTQEKREELIDGIFNKVKGFGYSSFVANGTNAIDYNIGDVFEFENAEGNLVKSIILKKTTKGTEIELQAPSITKAAIEYTIPDPVTSLVKNALIEVNRDINQINIEVSTLTDEVNEELAQLIVNQNSIETTVANNQTEILEKFDGYATTESVTNIEQSVTTLTDSNRFLIEFSNKVTTDGVTKVDTTTGITMNENGIEIDVAGSPVKSITDEKAIQVIDTNNNELKSYNGYVDGEIIEDRPELSDYKNETINYNKNLIFEDWLSSNHFRLEEFEEDGETFLGFFYTGE